MSDAAAAIIDVTAKYRTFIQQQQDWATGTATGGPNHDGRYPFTMPDGTVILLPAAVRPVAIEIPLGFSGVLGDAERLPAYRVERDMVLPASLAGAAATVLSGPPAVAVAMTLNRWSGGASAVVAEIDVTTNGEVFCTTTNNAAIPLAAGDLLYLQGPSISVPSFTFFSFSVTASLA